MTDAEPDLSQYQNSYVEKLKALIEARVEGEELVTPPAEPSPPVINLMDALKASVQQVKKADKPQRKMASARSTLRRRPSGRRRSANHCHPPELS